MPQWLLPDDGNERTRITFDTPIMVPGATLAPGTYIFKLAAEHSIMKHTLLHDAAGQKTYALVFEMGDEVISALEAFARNERLSGAHFTAIGAFSSAVLGYFDWGRKEYDPIPIGDQVEVLMLAGDVALKDDTPAIHAHVVLGTRDGHAHGGHLLEAWVRPTLELVLIESPGHLRRRHDPETGLALIALPR